LCENRKSNSAKVLLRTLFEIHIDVIYHQLGDSEKKLAFSTKTMFDERLVVLKEILDLIHKYPNQESDDPKNLFNKSYLNWAIIQQTEQKDAVLRANPNLHGTKHLQQKARLCEVGLVKNAEKGQFEKMYTLIYRYLSPVAHLNIEGLQAFIDQDEFGAVFFHDGNDEAFIASQAIEISVAFIKDLYDNNILISEEIGIIKDIEEMLFKVNIKFREGLKLI
jgi:hypothetical protein